MKLLLANIDYAMHTTDEGEQLQRGLEAAGWVLAGFGFGDGCRDVPTLIERYKPSYVLVQDKRDWDSTCGAFRRGLEFERLGFLAECHDIFKLAVVKDAGSVVAYHQRFCEEIGADAVVTYYHDESVLKVAKFLEGYRRVRTYHSVDVRRVPEFVGLRMQRPMVSGAVSSVYPLRQRVVRLAPILGCDVFAHPGYGNRGSETVKYLQTLSRYKVHVATASAYGFALRKIIETVACGATPITDLPAYDVLPGIDGALIRIDPGINNASLSGVMRGAVATWNDAERRHYADAARRFYDWRDIGRRLDSLIMECSK